MSTTNDEDLPPGMSRVRDPEFAARFKKFEELVLWFLNQTPLREQYGGRFVLVHNREVIGDGRTPQEAEEDAHLRAAKGGVAMPPGKELYLFGVLPMDCLDPYATAEAGVPATPPHGGK